jgi:dissimilatory sulfite reductase (desulfoviridin) alpha/beta subunit
VAHNELADLLEERLRKRDLRAFLQARVKGPLKLHHEFRVSVSDCPNACSRPQIADMGLIGARRPEVTDGPCSRCGACVACCREGAIDIEGESPVVDGTKCLACGKCIDACPSGTLGEGTSGFRILVGGKLGRHPRLGTELAGSYPLEEAIRVVDQCLDVYQEHCREGERFGEILERTGGVRIPVRSMDRPQGLVRK